MVSLSFLCQLKYMPQGAPELVKRVKEPLMEFGFTHVHEDKKKGQETRVSIYPPLSSCFRVLVWFLLNDGCETRV